MAPPSSRMTKQPPKPTRYRPGKAEVQDESEEEDSSSEEEVEQPLPKAVQPKASSFPTRNNRPAGTIVPQAAEPPKDDLEGFITASSSEDEAAGEGSSGSEDDQDEDSSGEEESSSDDEPKKPMLRPTFISKAKRAQQATTTQSGPSEEDLAAEEERKRKEKADEMLQAQLERDAAARAAGRKAWDDDADIDPEDEVDDTDGIDPEAEKAAWKLRELKRVRRDRLAIEDKEKEREEIERRRNLTAEEREAEDQAYIEAQKAEQDGKGKMAFMQRYHHKGAFFQGDEQDEDVKMALNRDVAGAKFVDDAGDKSVLPEYMKIRDMTRLGKKGRTRYKDLKSEDTGRWGDFGRKRRQEDGDVDDRFKPDDFHGEERTGANNAPLGERRSDHDRPEPKRVRHD